MGNGKPKNNLKGKHGHSATNQQEVKKTDQPIEVGREGALPSSQSSKANWQAVISILTLLVGILGVVWGPELTARVFFPTATPSPVGPTLTVSAVTPTTLTTFTDVPPSLTLTVTPSPTQTPVPSTLVTNTPIPCNWQAYDNGSASVPDPSLCLSDLAFGNLGVSDLGANKVEFVVSNNHAGFYGMVLPLGPVQKIKKGSEFIIKLNIKELNSGRFIIAFSPLPRPDVESAYAVAINPDASRLVTKFLYFPASGIPDELTFSDQPPMNRTQGVDYVIKFIVSYPSLTVDVNSGAFRPKARQINFNEGGYIFVGYQRLASVYRTIVSARVQLP